MTSEASVEVVTLGEVMALLLAEAGVPLGLATAFSWQYAGAEATVAVGLARLGHRTAFVGRLGEDPMGRQVRAALRGEGVDVEALLLDPEAATGLLVRDALTDRPISVEYHRAGSAATRLSRADVPLPTVTGARVLHLTGITAVLSGSSCDAVLAAAHTAREAGVTVCLDPNVRLRLADERRWREVLDLLAPLADVVLTGVDDARIVTSGDPAAWFHERGAATVVVKDGARGAWESDGDRVHEQPAIPARVADVVGAGDAFAAGWLSGWLRDLAPADRLREAAAAASLAVGCVGDTPGLPDRRTLASVLSSEGDVRR